jgi:hypothetical protein
MMIIQSVIEDLAVPPIGYEPQLPQLPQLVTDRRLRHPEAGGEIADAHLSFLKSAQDTQPGPVTHGLEQLRELIKLHDRKRGCPGMGNSFLMDASNPAPIHFLRILFLAHEHPI